MLIMSLFIQLDCQTVPSNRELNVDLVTLRCFHNVNSTARTVIVRALPVRSCVPYSAHLLNWLDNKCLQNIFILLLGISDP